MAASDQAMSRVGTFTLGWGESARWDDNRGRLYFVDCASQMLHWLDSSDFDRLNSLRMPSMPTGVVLTEDDAVVVVADEGLLLVEPDDAAIDVLAPYPDAAYGRCNDAAADLDGNLVTGTLSLNLVAGEYWQFSMVGGWRRLHAGISNANGPAVIDHGNGQILVFGDTVAGMYYAFDYDPEAASATRRRILLDTDVVGGRPDGVAVDAEGGVWCALVSGSRVARVGSDGDVDVLDVPVDYPTDLAFGGVERDRLFMTSISITYEETRPIEAASGQLLVLDGLGTTGRREPRFRLNA